MIRRKPRHLEDGEAMALMRWASLTQFRGKRVSDVIFAIPNGGKRNAREAARLKKMGVRAGVPDYFVHVLRKEPTGLVHGGLFLELKAGDRPRLSDAQAEQVVALAGYGYDVAVCHGWQAAADRISQYLALPCSSPP